MFVLNSSKILSPSEDARKGVFRWLLRASFWSFSWGMGGFCLFGFGAGWLPLILNYTSCSRKFYSNTLFLHGWQNCRLLFITFHFLLFSLFFGALIKTSLCWYLSLALVCCAVFPLAFVAPGNWLIKPLVHKVIGNVICLVYSLLYRQRHVGLRCVQIDNFYQKWSH